MPDLFEGFRWREVVAVLAAFTFFLLVMIDTVKDLDTVTRAQDDALRARVRALEIKLTAMECAINPEICRAISRGD